MTATTVPTPMMTRMALYVSTMIVARAVLSMAAAWGLQIEVKRDVGGFVLIQSLSSLH